MASHALCPMQTSIKIFRSIREMTTVLFYTCDIFMLCDVQCSSVLKTVKTMLHKQKYFFQTQPLLSNLTVLTLQCENESEER